MEATAEPPPASLELLEERIGQLDEALDSTRKRFDAHLSEEAIERKAMAAALQAIQLDVHAIREGKKALVAGVRIALVILGLTGAGVVVAARWVGMHAMQDWQTQNDPSRHKEIQ